MVINYLYIDDEQVEGIVNGLNIKPSLLHVSLMQHKLWNKQLEYIIKNQSKIDGLLLDWGLTKKNTENQQANFSVEALAQQLRSYTIGIDRRLKKDFPIVLCSAQSNFKDRFSKELTAHDLFDAIYEKNDFSESNQPIYELASLSKGYKEINRKRTAKGLLGLNSSQKTDFRILSYLDLMIREKSPIHEIARFILTKIIKIQGVLIDEQLLASRLGVDISKSPDKSWKKLLANLEKIKYSGVFSDFKYLWWEEMLNSWLEKSFGGKSLSPEEKIKYLNNTYSCRLKVAVKTEKSKSNDFWVVCKKTGRPIALEDAVIANMDNNEVTTVPWQDNQYYSIDEALRVDINLIAPSERSRVQRLKSMYPNKRPKNDD